MTVVFPFYDGDAASMLRLLQWVALLGGCEHHHAVLCADSSTPYQWGQRCMNVARKLFHTTEIITTDYHVQGWPEGANALFQKAAFHIEERKLGPWLWMESDCIPLKYHWLDQLETRYAQVNKPVLGAIIPCSDPKLPPQHVSGCAIYPENFWSLSKALLNHHCAMAFDLAVATLAVPLAANDPLFHCFWGTQELAPVFVERRQELHPPNQFMLEHVRAEAVLFHRNKDGSLIRLLRKKYFPNQVAPVEPTDFVVALPFSNKDAPLQIACLKWMAEMGQRPHYDCLLAWDQTCIQPFVADMQQAAKLVFAHCQFLLYAPPKTTRWPQAPNWAFQQVARHMEKLKRSWLWKEPDMIPLKADWIDVLQEEYHHCQKPFMGSVVPNMHHCNGTAIYPWDLPRRCPSAMRCIGEAFDTAMAKEMMPHCHNAIHLMQHIWGLDRGEPHPSVGTPIHFDTLEQLHRWIDPQAVTFHRVKDTSLINVLRQERNLQPA